MRKLPAWQVTRAAQLDIAFTATIFENAVGIVENIAKEADRNCSPLSAAAPRAESKRKLDTNVQF